jgi:hypothetical protein
LSVALSLSKAESEMGGLSILHVQYEGMQLTDHGVVFNRSVEVLYFLSSLRLASSMYWTDCAISPTRSGPDGTSRREGECQTLAFEGPPGPFLRIQPREHREIDSHEQQIILARRSRQHWDQRRIGAFSRP